MDRLQEAARSLRPPITGGSAIAEWLNVSPQRVTNWARRGVSRAGALAAQELSGYSANWILTGQGEMLVIGSMTPAAKDDAPAPAGITPEQLELLAEWKDIPPWKRGPILDRIREAAAQSRDEKAYYLGADGKKNTATAELKRQPAGSRTAAVVTHGDGNPKQTALLLSVAANPFDPESASANEKEWYRRLAARPKASEL